MNSPYLDNSHAPSADSKLGDYLFWVFALFVAVSAGVVANTGDIKLIGIFGGVFAGLVTALYPAVLFWMALFVGFVVSGLVQLYLPEYQLIRWAIVPVTALLMVHALVDYFQSINDQQQPEIPSIIWLAFLFIIINILTAILNLQDIGSILVGFKGYFQVWGLMFALALIRWDKKLIDALPRAILVIALIQMPFVLHQYLFLVPARVGVARGVVPLDIVSGTFGGTLGGGGANAALSVFMFVVWSVVIALWKNKSISTLLTLLLTAILLFPVLINDAKMSVIYVVLAFVVVFRKGVIRNLARFIGVSMITILMVAAMFTAYIHNAPEHKGINSWSDLLEYTYNYNIAKQEAFGGQLSRSGVMSLWAKEHGGVVNTLFGYGVGATRAEKSNDLSRKIGVNTTSSLGMGNIAAFAILWETGILGLLVLTFLYYVAFRNAGHLEKQYSADPWQSGIFLGIQGAIVILFVSLWHKNFFVLHIGYQTIPVLIFGYLAYWMRRSGQQAKGAG